jgi:hypothetical protein
MEIRLRSRYNADARATGQSLVQAWCPRIVSLRESPMEL